MKSINFIEILIIYIMTDMIIFLKSLPSNLIEIILSKNINNLFEIQISKV